MPSSSTIRSACGIYMRSPGSSSGFWVKSASAAKRERSSISLLPRRRSSTLRKLAPLTNPLARATASETLDRGLTVAIPGAFTPPCMKTSKRAGDCNTKSTKRTGTRALILLIIIFFNSEKYIPSTFMVPIKGMSSL